MLALLASCVPTASHSAWLPSVTLGSSPAASVPGSAGGIAVSSNGAALAVWSDDGTGRFQVNAAIDTTGVWSPVSVITSSEGDAITPHACIDTNGHVHLVWADSRIGDFEIYHREWLGDAWSAETRVTSNASRAITPVVVARGGDATVLWVDDRDGNTEIYARRRQNGVWGADTRITAETHDSLMPSAAIGADGVLRLVWIDNRSGTFLVYEATRSNDVWSAPLALSSSGITVTDPHVVVSDDLSAHAVWIDYRSGTGALYGRHKIGASWGAIAALSLSAAPPDRIALAGGPVSTAAIAWTETAAGNPGVFTSTWNGAAWSGVTTLTGGTSPRTLPAIGVSSLGDQVAIWADGTTDVALDVRAARSAGSAPVIQTIAPDSAMAGGPAHFTVTGTSFLAPDSLYVRDAAGALIPALASVSRAFSVVDSDFDLGAATPGPADVIVRTADGRRDTLSGVLTITPSGGWSMDNPLGSPDAASYTNLANGRSIAIGDGGVVLMAWIDERWGTPTVALSEFVDNVYAGPTAISNLTSAPVTPAVAAATGNRVEVVWRDAAPDQKDLYWRERNNGVWLPEVKITSGAYVSYHPHLAGDPYTGDVLLAWRMDIGTNPEIYFKRLHLGVWSAEARLTINTYTSTTPVCAAGPGGRAYVAWTDYRDGNAEVYFKQYDGLTWGADTRITTTSTASVQPAIAVAPSGDVHLAWQDGGDNGSTEIYHRVLQGGAWGGIVRVTTTAGASVSPTLSADGLGTVHLTWADATGTVSQVYYASHTTAWSVGQQISRGTVAAQGPCVAATPGGSVHALWTDSRAGQPTVYYANKRVIPTTVGDDPAEAGGTGALRLAVFPNPARECVSLALLLPRPARITMDVMDAAGRVVAHQEDAAWRSGTVREEWAGARRARAGVYYVRVRLRFDDATEREERVRVVLLR